MVRSQDSYVHRYYEEVIQRDSKTGKDIRKKKCLFCNTIVTFDIPETGESSTSPEINHLVNIHKIPEDKIHLPFEQKTSSTKQRNLEQYQNVVSVKEIALLFCRKSLPRRLFLDCDYRKVHNLPPKNTLGWTMSDFDSAIQEQVKQ